QSNGRLKLHKLISTTHPQLLIMKRHLPWPRTQPQSAVVKVHVEKPKQNHNRTLRPIKDISYEKDYCRCDSSFRFERCVSQQPSWVWTRLHSDFPRCR